MGKRPKHSRYILKSEEERKDFFLNQREKFNGEGLARIEKSAVLIFLNRTCFNGLYRVNRKGKFNVPFGRYTNPTICDEKTILTCSKLLQKVEILHGDFTKTIDFAVSSTLFYFDPPYKPLSATSSFNSYSEVKFDDAEQIRLRDFCTKVSSLKHWLILSNSDVCVEGSENNFFDEIYSDFNIRRVQAVRKINSNPEKRGKLSELLITNY